MNPDRSSSAGTTVMSALKASGLDTSYIRRLNDEQHASARTAQYIAVNDSEKSLVMAMADMGIFSNHSFPAYWKSAVASTKPEWLVVDGNWSENDIRAWIAAGKENKCQVAFEPVSNEKSIRLFSSAKEHSHLGVFPNADVNLASPNNFELEAMYTRARENGYFDNPEWFEVIDSFGLRGARERFVSLTSAELTDAGVPVQTMQLLPYIPTIVTKLGANGVLLTSILAKDDPRLRDRAADPFILARAVEPNSPVGGVYMRLFPAAERVDNVVSVNGVGDTFFGTLVAGLAKGGKIENVIGVAQKAAVLTLRSSESVSPDLRRLEEDFTASIGN
jgi:pseudouridylate synthase / pseudouridine kinase